MEDDTRERPGGSGPAASSPVEPWRRTAETEARRYRNRIFPVVIVLMTVAVFSGVAFGASQGDRPVRWALVVGISVLTAVMLGLMWFVANRRAGKPGGMFSASPLFAVEKHERKEVLRRLQRGEAAPSAEKAELYDGAGRHVLRQRRMVYLWVGLALLRVPPLFDAEVGSLRWSVEALAGVLMLSLAIWTFVYHRHVRRGVTANARRWGLDDA